MSPRRTWSLVAVAAVALLVPTGCGTGAAAGDGAAAGAVVADCAGRDVVFPADPRRVVTVDGWAAQTLVHLGLSDRIVGTGFAGPLRVGTEPYAAAAESVPVLAERLPSTEVVAAQRPDVVVTGFPAFGGAPGTPTDADLATMGATGLAACLPGTTDDRLLTDLTPTYDFLTRTGRAFGVAERAENAVRDLRARVDAVGAAVGTGRRPRVLALADDPVAGQPVKALGGGTIPNAIVHLAGGDNVFDDVTSMHADVSPEKVVELDPELIWVVSDFSFARSTGPELAERVRANPLLASTTAVREGRIVSTSQYVVGFPGPLNVDGLEQLAAALHPTTP
ncbi:ABC transporter substrate-binding protein [Umezawaea beigongshangensis]|uniref:ABC transporter substrate-binding protein n=1 Tax=Umezawaea beigongshangensis TaxID=2780383 RepID=UPI0018F1FC4A|nr:ABC transporter substrate-binding protein [Umezawaea beigongshangensis]